MSNDKPSIVAQQAQQAATIAQEAATAVAAVPGVPNKGIVLHVLGGIVVAGGAVAAIATMGVGPGIATTIGMITAYVVGWLNPTPTAVAQFGTGAK